jgi:LmbE family N-acetylglucosaminyl deacetylase
MAGSRTIKVLHLSPHPDDELIGAPATLMGLRDAGHEVMNLACSLGNPEQHERRRAELERAMELARFAWQEMDPPLPISGGDDLGESQKTLAAKVEELVKNDGYHLVVSPTPHDGHHGHEVVGRAAAEALERLPNPPRWWMWSLWADLPLPTLFVLFDEARKDEILRALKEHAGEVERSDYPAVVEGRSRAARVLGVERAFGWGEPKKGGPHAWLLDEPRPYAELLTEAVRQDDEWFACRPRVPDFDDPLSSAESAVPIGWWLAEPSLRERFRPPE